MKRSDILREMKTDAARRAAETKSEVSMLQSGSKFAKEASSRLSKWLIESARADLTRDVEAGKVEAPVANYALAWLKKMSDVAGSYAEEVKTLYHVKQGSLLTTEDEVSRLDAAENAAAAEEAAQEAQATQQAEDLRAAEEPTEGVRRRPDADPNSILAKRSADIAARRKAAAEKRGGDVSDVLEEKPKRARKRSK